MFVHFTEKGAKDTPHYKLMVLLEEELPECHRRETTDDLAEKFCVNHGSSKNSRKRLSRTLFLVPRTRLDLLPQYARLAATLDRVYKDICPPLVGELEKQFYGLAKFKKNQNLEARLKNARFLAELTKFRVAPPIIAFRCMKTCLDDFAGYNIDVLCCLLEFCGRYLFRTKHTFSRLSNLLETMMRLRKARNLDLRSIALIDSAFFMVKPPERAKRQVKVLPPLEAYIKYVLMVKLVPEEAVVELVTKQLLRLPWNSPTEICGELVAKYMVKACYKGRYMAVGAVSQVAAGLRRSHPEIHVRLTDSVLEGLERALEEPALRDQQRTVSLVRLLGELYASSLVSTSVVFDMLYHFVDFGHEVPEALRQASSGAAALQTSLPTISQPIKEDEELEADETDGAAAIVPVGVSQYSKYDPRVPSLIDPPTSVLRIKLVCTLLDVSGQFLAIGSNLAKLQRFMTRFQRYLFTKPILPAEIEFGILDTFDSLESRLKDQSKKDERTPGAGKEFVRYSSWFDAHNATTAAEETEALLLARAKSKLIAKGGSGEPGTDEPDDGDSMSEMEEEEDYDADVQSACSSAGADVVSASDDSESRSDGESDSDDEDGSDTDDSEELSDEYCSESDSGTDDTHETDVDDIDEEEMDEEAVQAAYTLQLEAEIFDREVRKLTMEALEKGKSAARVNVSKTADTMVHASNVVAKRPDGVPGGEDPVASRSLVGDGSGVSFKLLKRGHRGRVEVRDLVVPAETNLARQAGRHDDEAARERDLLKARVLQYEAESSELYSGNVYMDQTKLQVIRNRPLSMEDIDRNFGTTGGGSSSGGGEVGRPQSSSSGREIRPSYTSSSGGRGGGRGRGGTGGRTLRMW